MKRIFLLATLLAWLAGGLAAQAPFHRYSLDAMTGSLFERLDKSVLQSGILLQQSAMFVNPFRFDGTVLNDSNQMDASRFGKLFGQLRAASTGQPVLPDPAVYLNGLRQRPEHSDTVLLAVLAMQFDYIRADAFDTGLLQWDADNKVIAVPGQSTSPYGLDTTFAFAALTQQVTGAQVVFRLPSQLIFNNIGWTTDSVQVDFGDGEGWRTLNPNDCVIVQYPHSGPKILRLQVRQNGRDWAAHSYVTVPEPVVTERYSATPDEIITLGGVALSIFFNCDDHKLRKPLIVVEGFGGDIVSYEKMQRLIDYPTTNNGKLNDFLDTEGYDLIWVDWSNSNNPIQNNAEALQGALEFINARKHADGSSEPNVMIGASMGGLIGKYCLLHMHNVQGIDAEVERFFTFDSPLTGANFPVGIQLFIRDLLSLSSSAASDPDVQEALQLLDGYAATQMLRQKAIIDGNGNLALSSGDFDALQAEINDLSAIRPLGSITRFIALSNGSGNGTEQESVNNAIALEFSLTLDGVPWGGVPYWQYDVLVQGTAYTANKTNTLLYERTTKVIPITGQPWVEESVSYTHPVALGLDVAPGGTTNIGLAELESALDNAFSEVSDQIGYYINVPMSHFCFIPTVSSFDLPISADLFGPSSGGAAARSSASMDNSVSSPYGHMQEFNQEHVTMNVRIADVLVDELSGYPTLSAPAGVLATGEIYNFGKSFDVSAPGGVVSTPRNIAQNIIIKNGAQLWINRKVRIAYTSDLSNPLNGAPQAFYVAVPGTTCEGSQQVVVTIEDGGRLQVGDNAVSPINNGGLVFTSASELHAYGAAPMILEDGSQVSFDGGSRFELKANALLRAKSDVRFSMNGSFFVMQPGAKALFESKGNFRLSNTSIDVPTGAELALFDGSQLSVTGMSSVVRIRPGATLRLGGESNATITAGTTLILDPGAIVILESSGANIRIEGDLVVNGDINFQGLGFFDFGPGNRLVFGPGYKTFNLSGAGKNKRFVRLSADVIVNNANRLHWSNGLVEVGGTLLFSQGAGLNFNQMTLQGVGVGVYNAVEATESGAMNFQGCEILNLSEAISGRGGLGCTVNSCTFSNNTAWGVYWTDAFEVSVRNSMFNGTNSGMALFMENLFRLEVKNCHISGHLSPIQGVINDSKLMSATPAINLYNVIVCLLNNSHFSGNTVAVKAADPLEEVTSNVIAYGGTSFVNHDAAIFVNGTATGGAVLADCTVFQDNRNGIRGRDITLMIDSKNTKNTIFDTDSPNRFIRDNVPQGGMTTGHVRICYTLKAPGGSSLMRNNFWQISSTGSGTSNNDPTPLNFLSLLEANCSDVAVVPDITPVAQKNPICTADERPPSFEDAFPGSECSVSVSEGGSSTASVHEQFHFGAFLLKADSVLEAVEVLRPVAALWQADLSGFPENCQQYIQVAKALVDGSDNSLPDGDLPRPGGDRAQKVSTDQLLIAPNPAHGSTLVYLSEASSQLSVWDANGTLMHQAMPGETATYRIEMGGWKPGIYLVKSINMDGRIQTGKIVLH